MLQTLQEKNQERPVQTMPEKRGRKRTPLLIVSIGNVRLERPFCSYLSRKPCSN